MITQSELHRLFDYDPITGVIIRRRTGEIVPQNIQHNYPTVSIGGYGTIPKHRFAWLYHYGSLPTRHIRHKNGDKMDNRIENLICPAANEPQQKKYVREWVPYPVTDVDNLTSYQRKINTKVARYTSIGYRQHGKHLVRDNGDETKTYLLNYERYLAGGIEP